MASRRERKEQLKRERLEQEQRKTGTTQRVRRIAILGGSVIIAAAVVLTLILISQGGGGGSDVESADKVKAELKGIEMEESVMGSPKAPVKITEFADMQCPFCKKFSDTTLQELIKRYVKTGKVRMEIAFLTFIGPDSTTAAEAALAAGMQDRTWHFAELVYKNHGAENTDYVTDEYLEGIAKSIPNFDVDRWKKDRKSSSHSETLAKTEDRAQEAGADSTPSFVIEGPKGQEEFISGVADLNKFTSVIDPMLKDK